MFRIYIPWNYDLKKLISQVYNLSVPVGMGTLHFKSGLIPEETLTELYEKLITKTKEMEEQRVVGKIRADTANVLFMDYVHGRCCKFSIYFDFKKQQWYLLNSWFEHSAETFEELLRRVGLENAK